MRRLESASPPPFDRAVNSIISYVRFGGNRQKACDALREFQDPRAADALASGLLRWEGHKTIEEAIIQSLVGMGLPALVALTRLSTKIYHDHYYRRRYSTIVNAADRTAHSIGDAAVAPLLEMFDSGYYHSALLICGRFGDKRVINRLLQEASQSYWDPTSAEALLLKDLQWAPRNITEGAFKSILHREVDVVETLNTAVVMPLVMLAYRYRYQTKSENHLFALNALSMIGSEAILAVIMNTDSEFRGKANEILQLVYANEIHALGQIGGKRELEQIILALQRGTGMEAAIEELDKFARSSLLGDQTSSVVQAVAATGCRFQVKAITLLANTNSAEAIKPLLGFFRDGPLASLVSSRVQALLASTVTKAESIVLRDVMNIPNIGDFEIQMWDQQAGSASEEYREIDCSEIRNIARQELLRRGAPLFWKI